MTRADLLLKLARRTDKNTTLDTATQNRLVDFINERNRRLASFGGTELMRAATLSVSSTANSNRMAIVNAQHIYRVYEATNDRVLQAMTLDQYRNLTPDTTAVTGTPTHYVIDGMSSVATQPSSATGLWVESNNAGDTQTLYLEGARTDNHPLSASVTVTGTTAVQVGSSTAWTRVDRWYLSSAAVGFVTLYTEASTTNELGTIAPGSTETHYHVIYLYPTPSSSITYSVDISRVVTDMSVANDAPDLPEDWHDLVLLGALMDEYAHMDDSRYQVAAQEYQQRERQFRHWLAMMRESHDGRPMASASRLGAWYPAGT